MTAPYAGSISERVNQVRARIAQACDRVGRDPSLVTLIAASKTQDFTAIQAAIDAGIGDFGENRVQEALEKRALFADQPRWHLIGHLQSNKVKPAAGRFAILHGIDSERLVRAVAGASSAEQPVMIEVNASGEESKHGVAPVDLADLVKIARSLPNVSLEGLMTVAPRCDHAEQVRAVFRQLHELSEEHGLVSLSMGMTDDFEVAIEEGATHVRVGRAIFGERLA